MKQASKNIVIATIRPWNIERAKTWKPPTGYKVHLISDPKKLTIGALRKLEPRYVFFPHWSVIIPEEIFSQFECVVFHETDLPFGRGGSPLQNLIVRGIYRTKISALRVEAGIDTGPIYMKKPLDLKKGSAQEIFEQVSVMVFTMMREIIVRNPTPKPQRGEAVVFKRRKPEESRIPHDRKGRALYDFIRMLDAPGYPYAFIEIDGMTVIFKNASLKKDGSVEAEAIINITT